MQLLHHTAGRWHSVLQFAGALVVLVHQGTASQSVWTPIARHESQHPVGPKLEAEMQQGKPIMRSLQTPTDGNGQEKEIALAALVATGMKQDQETNQALGQELHRAKEHLHADAEKESEMDSQSLYSHQTTVATTTESTPALGAPHCEFWDDFKVCRVMLNHECQSRDVNMSSQQSLKDCAQKVMDSGGRFMVYGSGGKNQQCFQELPGTDADTCLSHQDAATCCPQFWQADEFDFWVIIPTEAQSPTPAVQNHGERGKIGFAVFAALGAMVIPELS